MKKTNPKIDTSNETVKAIFNSVRDGLVIVDKTGKIIKVSQSLIKIGGYPEKELVGNRLNFLKMFTPKSMMKILMNFAKTLADNEILPYEVEGATKKGEKKFAEISGSPLKAKGKIIGVVAIFRDITKQKKAEEELREKNEELEKFKEMTIGRELKLIELKNKVKELEEKLNEHGKKEV